MYIRLIIIFGLIFTWIPALNAQENEVQENQAIAAPATVPPPAQKTVPDEITLEANVVQIILNDEHRSGVDWGAIVSDFHTAPLKKENDPAWNDKKHRVSFGTVSEDDYTVLLDALDMAGQVSQFPQPPIKVIAGTLASLNFPQQNIHVDFSLSRLKSGELSLRIDPRIAVAATEIWNGEKIPASVLLKTETKTLVANDMTIVIGGLMKEEVVTRKHKLPLLGNIPVLGDIPIFGLVFRYKGHLVQKTETVIFLTVRTKAVDVPEEEDDAPL